MCRLSNLTCVLPNLEVLRQQFVLPVAQYEGQEGEDEGVHDADDGQDVSPAHCAVPQRVLICALATHALHLLRVPAIGVYHTPDYHTGGYVMGKKHTDNLFGDFKTEHSHVFICKWVYSK